MTWLLLTPVWAAIIAAVLTVVVNRTMERRTIRRRVWQFGREERSFAYTLADDIDRPLLEVVRAAELEARAAAGTPTHAECWQCYSLNSRRETGETWTCVICRARNATCTPRQRRYCHACKGATGPDAVPLPMWPPLRAAGWCPVTTMS